MTAWTEGAVRLAVLFGPLALLVAATVARRPGLRQRMAALLATITAAAGVVSVNAVAAAAGWWSFDPTPGALVGQPLDLVLAWAVLWGAVPTLFDRWSVPTTVAALGAVDLVAMPFVPGVTLGGNWLVGEVVALVLVAAPAVTLGRLTSERRHLGARVSLQVVTFGVLLVAVVPLASRALLGSTPAPHGLVVWAGLQVAALGALVALTAVQELYERGQGTPWPWDPPRRLVSSGPYAYVSNPMQLGAVVLLLGESLVLWNVVPAAIAVTGAAFSVVNASRHERATIGHRLGDAWDDYHRAVPSWRPRWRPARVTRTAVLWVAADCGPCDQLGGWLRDREPTRLAVGNADERPGGRPRRVTYNSPASADESGVVAFARALEHVHLGWALTGFVLRLPVVRSVAAAIADEVGFGPIDSTVEEVPACPATVTRVVG